MRTLHQRVLVTFVATLIAAGCGMLVGYSLGRAITLKQTMARLDQYATRIANEGQTATAESRAVLAKLNASTYPYCSEAEVAYFRQIVFRSLYLKGAGRMHDGKIDCSTILDREAQSGESFKPDFAQKDGTLVYQNLPPFHIAKQTVIAVQLGDSFIVYNPFNLRSSISPSMHFTVTDLNAPAQQTGRLVGEVSPIQGSILTHQGHALLNGNLYDTRCSSDGAVCTTTFISVPDAIKASRSVLAVFIALGGLAGGSLGFLLSLIYRRNRSLTYQLQRAIRKDTLRVVYQPIVELEGGRIVEAEALARWSDADKIPIAPDVFIKVAEERGFVGSITRLVIRHVLDDFGALLRARPDFRVNVNIAASDLADPEFLPMLSELLERTGVAPQSLGIEITESYTARQQIAKETILHLRQRGHFVHIDDFGTGYSSLAYLHDLAVDAIKIDKAFTKAIGTEAVTVSILPQILTMADTLNLRVVVEGIETPQQANYFRAANQDIYAQGWFFGRPISADEFHRVLAQSDKPRRVQPVAEVESEVHESVQAV